MTKRPSITWQKVAIAFAASLIAIGVCSIPYLREAGQLKKNICDRESVRVEIFTRLFYQDIQSVVNDLRLLADGDGLHAFLLSGNESDLDRAVHRALFFSQQKSDYDQIRYLDERGQEILRVNQVSGIVPTNQLQNKADRAYFQKARALVPGQIFISAFDLNVENGQIERPFKPMLRLATPVLDAKGEPRGVYIINYLGTNLFRHLQQFASQYQHRLRVLNAQGYWLKAARSEQEWGFMFPEREGMTLARTDPALWEQIINEPQGQIRHAGGIFTWQRVVPRDVASDGGITATADDDFLIIVSEITAGEWGTILGGLQQTFLIITIGVLLLTYVSLWLLYGRAQANDSLRENRAQLQAILDNSAAIVSIKNLEGRFILVNHQFERLFHVKPGEMTGKTDEHVFSKEMAERYRANDRKVIESRAPQQLEEIVPQDDGEHTYLSVKFPLFDDKGKPNAVCVISTDITDRKRAADELDRFFSLSLDFLCIAGPDGYFKRVSPAVTDILGWSVEEFLATPYIELVHPDDKVATLKEVERQVVRGERVLNFENRYRCKDGSWRVLSWRSMPQPDGLMYGTARDVTERKNTEEQIRQLNADLQQRAAQQEAANKELEAFSYSVSHDLRAPLRHVDGFVGLLEKQAKDKLDERSRHYLKTIAESARQMGTLIDDLLVFSRMGRTELRHTEVNLNSLVQETIEGLQHELAGRNIDWKISDMPVVHGDPAMLRQVFANLIGNAVKYTRPRNPAQIEIACAEKTAEEFIFFVKDNGVGFDMQYANKLFGVFQRLHRADEFEGTGIGLANVRRIIFRHGGRTWAEGKVDGGATLYYTLPTQPKGKT